MPNQEASATPGTQRVFRPDPRSFELREEHHWATFSASTPSADTVLVTVHGEVDAANSTALTRYVERRVGSAGQLVLDLQTVQFFAASGFAALAHINVVCERAGVRWSLLPGPHVDRMLRICDSRRELPIDRSRVQYPRARAGDRQLLVGGNH
ncbi:MAG: STAS domain-containing protein [Actinomycetota bacterium]|nr:STAS domain-containing protein [Actinomycetota bacterium]